MNQGRKAGSRATGLAVVAIWGCATSAEPVEPTAGGSSGAGGYSADAPSGATAGAGAVAGSATGGQGGGAGATTTGGAAAAQAGSSAIAGSASGGASGPGGGSSGGSPSVVCPAAVTIKAGDNDKTLMMGSVQRTYLVHAPPGYTGKVALPVVFDFHGLSGNGAQQKALSRWDKVGDAEGFIVVYPDGIGKAWNAGLCCTDDKTIDDVAFVRAIIAALQAEACVDPRRIYASGCSNGGGMSYKLACEAADVIAGVAPVDFDCVDGSNCAMCKPSRPITEVQFRGTKDQLVDYEGAGAFMGAEKNFALWGTLNSCAGMPAALASNAACDTYPTCGGGSDTILCTVPEGTHCGSYSSFMIPQVAWSVLKNEVLP